MEKHYKINEKPVYELVKRVADIICAVIGILATSPVWLFAVLGIEISDPGPVFYMAHRIGKDNNEFCMFKFRSMRVDRNAKEKSFKADTNRIFKFGELLRRLKIDELPQLVNVLNGSMSMVGPRPASADQADRVRAGINEVASYVKPGLTGPSALYDYIYGDTIGDEAEYEEKVLPDRLGLDVFYIRKRCLSYDVKMIWWTVRCILGSISHTSLDDMFRELLECVEKSREMDKKHRQRLSKLNSK